MAQEIIIAHGAAEKIRALLIGTEYGYGLRIKVVEGGCSGFEYKMEVDSPAPEDRVFETNGARVLLDRQTMLHVSGTELDYRSGLMQSGFVFNNPNVKGTCGCGTSFSA